MNTLIQLHTNIDSRVKIISGNHSDWLCRMGCDGCCKRLAETSYTHSKGMGVVAGWTERVAA